MQWLHTVAIMCIEVDGAVLKQCSWCKGWVVTMIKLVIFHSVSIYSLKNENCSLIIMQ